MDLPSLPIANVLVTGAAGFLGQALVRELGAVGWRVRSLDVVPFPESPGTPPVESIVGDVADPAAVARACEGQDALVIAHMAPNRPEVYASAPVPFDVNVKGTALLFEQAVKAKLRRVVLISSIAVVEGHDGDPRRGRLLLDLPPFPVTLYGLTKTLQEEIAAHYHRQSGLPVAVLRPAYVTDAETLTDKYGRRRPSVNWRFIDRRDVAGATRAALLAPGLTFGRYYLHGHPGAPDHLDVEPTRRDLGWSPRHDFSAYPEDAAV